ncbi:MAG: hypothetical protein V7731_21835 [Amphritea sp.]
MNQFNPSPPSANTLIKASTAATILAGAILTVAILPAEYNIDPTGFGETLGLTTLSAVEPVNQSSAERKPAYQKDTVSIMIPPQSGLEYKLHLLKGAKLKYRWTTGSWKTESTPLYFDFHGEPQADNSFYSKNYFESFTISTANDVSGSLTAPFEGSHGWYWKNSSAEAITVTLNIEGAYAIEGIK